MDNEFQWRSQMRKLNEAVEPARDLWPDIAARIAQEPAAMPARRGEWRRPAFAIAAGLLVAVGAGLTAYRLDRPAPAPQAASNAPATTPTSANDDPTLTALDWAKPSDPKLAAAARTLDKANADLQAALEARPDAVFLVSMLNRTNAQRMRLMRQPGISG
jgi:ferric-dicitrate binding protein FerR (iron transport regulator)